MGAKRREKDVQLMADTDRLISWRFLPFYPTFGHYAKILFQTPQFFIVFWNSMKITVSVLLGQLVIAVPAAWAFAVYRFRFRKLLFTLYVVLMLMPFQVTMLSSYLVLDGLGLMNRHGAIILPAIFSTYPVFLIYRGFCREDWWRQPGSTERVSGRFLRGLGFRWPPEAFSLRQCWDFWNTGA